MDSAYIRAFVNRSHSEIQASKREYWADRFRKNGPASTLQAGYALFEHARMVQPTLLDETKHASDLAHHIELKRLLDQVSHGLPNQ
jgi:hypothetical protein